MTTSREKPKEIARKYSQFVQFSFYWKTKEEVDADVCKGVVDVEEDLFQAGDHG